MWTTIGITGQNDKLFYQFVGSERKYIDDRLGRFDSKHTGDREREREGDD